MCKNLLKFLKICFNIHCHEELTHRHQQIWCLFEHLFNDRVQFVHHLAAFMAHAVDQPLGWALFPLLQDESHCSYPQGAFRQVVEQPNKLRVTCSMTSVLTKVGTGSLSLPVAQEGFAEEVTRQHLERQIQDRK